MTSIQMPQLGETIIEGTILKWLKQEGEQVEADEPLFEISTDKVDTEVPSPVAGTVTKILVAEGATVAVGTAVVEIDDGSAGAGGNGASAPAGCIAAGGRAAPAAAAARPPPLRRLRRDRAAGGRRRRPRRRPPRCPIGGRGRRSCRRSCGSWPRSTGSIWRTSPGRARADGSRRTTCWRRRPARRPPAARRSRRCRPSARRPRPWW